MQPHIGVVIAGNGRDPGRRPEIVQPFGGPHEFLGQAEIDEVAGHGDVVGVLLGQVARQAIEDLAPMGEFPPAMPVDETEHALAHQLAALHERQRAQMNVGEVGEGEHGASLLRWWCFSLSLPGLTRLRLEA